MTLIGVFNTIDGVTLFADRQETITDYAKWDCSKIKILELSDVFRVFMAGAGPSDTCDMIWEKFVEEHDKKSPLLATELREIIVRMVERITKKCILPFPVKERPYVDLIWVLQHKQCNPLTMRQHLGFIQVFRTSGLDVLDVRGNHFSGNPILLTKFLSNLFLDRTLFTMPEAEALAAYFLWEAKEYDPTCGKHSDVFTIRNDWTLGRLSRDEIKYWEEHFEHLKEAMGIVPLLSCGGSMFRRNVSVDDYLERLNTVVKTLAKEQLAWRQKSQKPRSKLEEKLNKNVTKIAAKHLKKRMKQSSTP